MGTIHSPAPLLIRKQNDCALLIAENQLYLLQTTLGWLFREISGALGEYSAIQYFRRLTSWDPQQTLDLRRTLGEYYKPKYEVLLEYINPKEFDDIKVSAEGKNGRVLSATWNPPKRLGRAQKQPLEVVLKHILDKNEKGIHNPLLKFLHEVYCPMISCKLSIRWKLFTRS